MYYSAKALRIKYNNAQTIITAISRAFIYKRRYHLALRRVVRIQALIRGFLSRLEQARVRKELLIKLQLLISKNVRAILARKVASIRKKALFKIQAIGIN